MLARCVCETRARFFATSRDQIGPSFVLAKARPDRLFDRPAPGRTTVPKPTAASKACACENFEVW
eukprot:1708932-Amphidinium_carterae.1